MIALELTIIAICVVMVFVNLSHLKKTKEQLQSWKQRAGLVTAAIPASALSGGITLKHAPQAKGGLPTSTTTEPLIGYRGWSISHDGLLVSANGTLWPERHAFIAAQTHCNCASMAPGNECTCGIYCFKTLGELMAETSYANMAVVGSVSLWGKVIAHEVGYRARKAYPRTLYYEPHNMGKIHALANAYAIECAPMPAAFARIRSSARGEGKHLVSSNSHNSLMGQQFHGMISVNAYNQYIASQIQAQSLAQAAQAQALQAQQQAQAQTPVDKLNSAYANLLQQNSANLQPPTEGAP